MTMWVVSLLVWLLFAPQGVPASPAPATDGSGTIAGVVTRLDDDKPIEGALVQLQRINPASSAVPASPDRVPPQSVRTNALGAYRFDKLPAGAYTLLVTANKFFPPDAIPTRPSGFGKRLDLTDGQHLEQVNLVLAPAGAIEGHALDEFGDPAPGVTMMVTQLMSAAGKSRLMPVGGRNVTVTDDRGAFRVFGLAPGDYYLVALSGPFGRSSVSAFSTPADTRAGFAPTYFPGTASAVDARPVHIGVGHDTAGVTFPLVPSPLFTVSGTVSGLAGATAGATQIMLLELHGGDVRAIIPANTATAPDGTFTYRNVPQGSYVVQAFSPQGFGATTLSVTDHDVADISVKMLPPSTMRGHMSFDGTSPVPPKDAIFLAVGPTDFVTGPVGGNRPPSVKVNDDYSFELPGLQNVGVLVGNAPPGWQLLRATVDGEDITDKPYDFRSHDVSNVDVVFTDRWGSVKATVLDVNEQPAPDCAVIVFSPDPTKWRFPTRYVRGGRANQQGIFIAGLLPSGTYLAVAVPQNAAPGPEYDSALLESLRGAATRVTLSTTGQTALTLHLVR